MKVLVVLSVLIACGLGSPAQEPVENVRKSERSDTTTFIPIIKYNREQGKDGSYKTEYETGNNINAEETGFIKDITVERPGGVLVQHGHYSYTAPDGQLVDVEYTADENGFRATSNHIPKAPEISPEIQKGLDLIYAGIALQKERALKDPEFAKNAEDRKKLDYLGQWYGQ